MFFLYVFVFLGMCFSDDASVFFSVLFFCVRVSLSDSVCLFSSKLYFFVLIFRGEDMFLTFVHHLIL